MSDPVTNVEIEDILSSIRRLVSEDSEPRPTPREVKRIGRLVLTPALRVKDGSDRPLPARNPSAKETTPPVLLTNPAQGPKAVDDDVEGRSLLTRLVFEEVARTIPAVVEDAAEKALAGSGRDAVDRSEVAAAERQLVGTSEEADTGTSDGPPEASALVRDATAEHALPVPGAHEEPAAEGAGPEDSEQEGGVFVGDDVLESKIAALEALVRNRVAREDDVVAGDPAEDIDPVDIVKHAAFHSVREARENLEDHRAEPDGEGQEFESDDLGEEGVFGVGEVSEAGIHAVAPAVSESTENDEPPLAYNEEPDAVLAELLQSVADATEAEAGETDRTVLPFGDTHSRAVDEIAEAEKTAEAIDWEDVAEANVRGADIAADPEPVPAAAAPADSPVAAREDMPMIDEAMLREMVSDIVRQELQGVLGERITRNVRKLVRREIHRVMMTQDFD